MMLNYPAKFPNSQILLLQQVLLFMNGNIYILNIFLIEAVFVLKCIHALELVLLSSSKIKQCKKVTTQIAHGIPPVW
ncbi:hypothetical protein ANANG_G00084030 [Anguilla anguilla]|uniref:Uncharacterized protein n=1 Tax=Anguilla anguilla TaxID=7936 RepID=A0A9D3S393_ANGAN|nr:hypothetical protein ANANG_G00084030 [Anguilla anguilla]